MTALPSDADLLALCVWTEAQGEPADGMAAVAQVVLHRMRLGYEDGDGTLQGAILHHNAFSAFGFDFVHGAYHAAPDAYTPGRISRMLTQAKASAAWSKCCRVVIAVQAGHYVGDPAYDRLTPDTVLYDNPRISHPAWATPEAFVTAIGQHSFYRDLTWRPHAPSAAPPTPADIGPGALMAAISHPKETT